MDGAAVTTGSLTNNNDLLVDPNDYNGGSSLTVDGTLTNSGTLQIGNSYLTSPTTVTVDGLDNDNTASIYLYGGSDVQAALKIGGAAGFGTSGILSGDVSLQGDTLIEFVSGGEITGIASDAQLSLSGTQAFIADSSDTSSNSALTGLSSNAGTLFLLDGAAIATTGTLTNSGALYVDTNDYAGGSSLTVDSTLTNSDTLQIGNSYLTSPTMVTVAGLDNTGSIYLYGGSDEQAALKIGGAAGFGTSGILSGDVSLQGDTLIEFVSGGEITGIASDAQLSLSGTQAFIADSSDTSGNSALTGLLSNAGALNLEDGAAIATTGTLTNSGALYVDTNDYAGGSSLMVDSVDSTLTNSGTLQIGNSYLTSPTMVTVAGLDNTGSIYLYGGSDEQAALKIGGAAGFGTSGILSGDVSLQGDTLIEFVSGGEITGIASDAQLSLSGTQAFIADSSDTSSNSALTGLSSNAGTIVPVGWRGDCHDRNSD